MNKPSDTVMNSDHPTDTVYSDHPRDPVNNNLPRDPVQNDLPSCIFREPDFYIQLLCLGAS